MLLKPSNRSLVKERGVSLATPIVYQSRTRMSTTFFKEFHDYGFKRVPLYGIPFRFRPQGGGFFLPGIASNFALLWCAPLRGRGVLNEMVDTCFMKVARANVPRRTEVAQPLSTEVYVIGMRLAPHLTNGGLVRTRTANSSLRRMRVTKLHHRPIGGHGQNRTATSSMPLKHSTVKLSAH